MFLAILGSTLSRESDPLLITLLLRPELTTAYMLTRRGADIVAQMLAVIYGATHSAFSHLVGHSNKEKISGVAFSLFLMAFVCGLVGFFTYVVMNHSFVTLWVGESYALDQGITLMLGIAYFAGSLRNMLWQLLNGFGTYHYASCVVLLEGVGKVLLAAVLLYSVGIVGMPFALLLGGGLSVIALLIQLSKHLELPFNKSVLVKISFVTIVLFVLSGACVERLNPGSWIEFALLAAGVVSAVCLSLAGFNWNLCKEIIKRRL